MQIQHPSVLSAHQTTSVEQSVVILKRSAVVLTSYLRLVVFSYLGTDDLLFRVALLSRQTRRQVINSEGHAVTSRLFTERQVKIVIHSEEQARRPYPRGVVDFADKLIIQSVSPFKCRGQVLEALFREMPSRFNNFKVKLYSNELPPAEMINQAVKREMKFSEIFLFNVNAEYTDKVDSLLKSTRNLRIFRSYFRQIFPRDMTNDVPNEIELLQLDEVDFQAKTTIFRCDRLKALSLKKSQFKQKQLQELTSNQIQTISIENQFIQPNQASKAGTSQQGMGITNAIKVVEDPSFDDFLQVVGRQQDLRQLQLNQSYHLPAQMLKMVARELPANALSQTRVSFATCGDCCSLDDIMEAGLLDRAQDTFIACDRLRQPSDQYAPQGSLSGGLFSSGYFGSQIMKMNHGKAAQSNADIIMKYKDHEVTMERIGLYKKLTVTQPQGGVKNELRIVTRQ
ncbi:hypothetical protein FGO68_gene7059 [Halteria grandinella]|uniref:Uncharacterized protein n=1 Tax=Halteria grandinella TaxID=5974 RepID=A0A8J8NTF0_HALGN|nr:hypothetical protein FGO68_gene7059 [Halteria grandinella]